MIICFLNQLFFETISYWLKQFLLIVIVSFISYKNQKKSNAVFFIILVFIKKLLYILGLAEKSTCVSRKNFLWYLCFAEKSKMSLIFKRQKCPQKTQKCPQKTQKCPLGCFRKINFFDNYKVKYNYTKAWHCQRNILYFVCKSLIKLFW